MYEYLRLYAWIAMPVFFVLAFAWRAWRNPAGIIPLAPLMLVWILGRMVTVAFGDKDSWALDAVINAFGALAYAVLAWEVGPKRALSIVCGILALQVTLDCVYGIHLIQNGYDKPTHRLYYWTAFAVAWAEVIVAAKWGGSGGKRRRNIRQHRVYREIHWGDAHYLHGTARVRDSDVFGAGRDRG